VPEIIDPVFAKTSQNARFLLSENERFGLVFVKTGSINSGTGRYYATLIEMFYNNFRLKVVSLDPSSENGFVPTCRLNAAWITTSG
jgi:hypothetical protein